MKKGTTKVAFLVTCLAAVVASSFFKVHYVLDGGGWMLLWNTTKSYLFLHVVERGYRVSYLEYPWEFFKQFFHSVPLPDDEWFSLVVVRVTPSMIERNVVDMPADTPGNDPTLFTQFDHQVFANCEGVLCRWTGTHFEKATEQEQRNVAGIEHFSPI